MMYSCQALIGASPNLSQKISIKREINKGVYKHKREEITVNLLQGSKKKFYGRKKEEN